MTAEFSNDPTVVSGRITIVVDLPQPIDKIAALLRVLGEHWGSSTVNPQPPVRNVAVLGGSLCHIPAE